MSELQSRINSLTTEYLTKVKSVLAEELPKLLALEGPPEKPQNKPRGLAAFSPEKRSEIARKAAATRKRRAAARKAVNTRQRKS